jgi:hypothetical protein
MPDGLRKMESERYLDLIPWSSGGFYQPLFDSAGHTAKDDLLYYKGRLVFLQYHKPDPLYSRNTRL